MSNFELVKKAEVCLIAPFCRKPKQQTVLVNQLQQIFTVEYQPEYKTKVIAVNGTISLVIDIFQSSIRVYLSLNKIVSIATTNLIYTYNQLDDRFHKLGGYLRLWKPDPLHFYPLQLMLLVYMQSCH